MSDCDGLLVRDGRVEAVDGHTVVVRVATAGSCARCARGEGCGFGFAAARAGEGRLVLPLPPDYRPEPGDTVRVALEQRGLAGAAVAVYGIPLAGLLAGSAAASLLGIGEPATVGLAFGAFAAALPLARATSRRMDAAGRCRPRLLAGEPAGVRADG
ncbi:SoxR reducing system RseC family protein [Lentisalinibacter salinarum]|uniref:SoxR reducing system RseC family protein n=1 Tax=Lentisalinibacter salinarum TaxID=2992239 RepID=UPI00386C24A5